MNSIQGNGSTLHVVGECVNRIGKGRRRRIEEAIRLILDCSENRTGV